MRKYYNLTPTSHPQRVAHPKMCSFLYLFVSLGFFFQQAKCAVIRKTCVIHKTSCRPTVG